jgi:ABC-2 type transport system permease protein
MSRSTSPREILPLIYGLAGVPPPSVLAAPDYPGYPLVLAASWARPWFFGLLPLAIVIFWWLSRRPPEIILVTQGEQ